MTVPRLLQLRRTGDDGVALPMVLGTMLILTVFMLSSLALVLNNMGPSRSDQDSKAALAAAQAGIDEYISRLNANSEYWAQGNNDATNAAFTSSVPIPGTGGNAARFRYQVLTAAATTAQQGYITLEVVGTSRPPGGGREISRTLTTRLEPRGFLDFIYYTDFETIDPSLLGYSQEYRDLCSRHYYDSYSSGSYSFTVRPDGVCPPINWTTGDVVDGPLHSNDALYVGGSVQFTHPRTESSWVKTTAPAQLWRGPGTPTLSGGGRAGYRPRYAPAIDLPDANTELLKSVRPKTDTTSIPDTDAARPGCLYRGATRIRFVGTQMQVYSPNTTNAPSRCLTTADNGNEQTKSIPAVIHVAPTTGSCAGVGYPRTDEDVTVSRTTDYAPCRGTVFVEGDVDGQVTVSAEDDVVVTGDVTVADRGTATDVVGLVAGNYVWIYHPVRSDGTNLLPAAQTVHNVEAAIMSLRHSFVVQNWDKGQPLSTGTPDSKLRVFGAIAQKFRGAVGTGTGTASSTGYLKNYVYDHRFQILQPPYFLAPKDAPWEAVKVTDG